MKMTLSIEIEPDDDGVHCYGCHRCDDDNGWCLALGKALLGSGFRSYRRDDYCIAQAKEVVTVDVPDARFICPQCGSEDVGLRPFYGSVSVCHKCKYTWNS